MNSKKAKFIRLIALGPLVLGVAVWGSSHVSPVPDPVHAPDLAPAPASAHATAGDAITINITSGQISDMYGYQFDLLYDNNVLEYTGVLASSISEISTIFAKEFDGYLRIGATKTGDADGFTSNRAAVCEVTLTAKKDCDLSEISISSVNVVQSDLTYMEGVADWTHSAKVNGS